MVVVFVIYQMICPLSGRTNENYPYNHSKGMAKHQGRAHLHKVKVRSLDECDRIVKAITQFRHPRLEHLPIKNSLVDPASN